jgi:acylphosphatase
MTRTVRFLVAGRVQGVFYRATAAERAAEYGLSGSVRNLADGRVELIASGAPDRVERLAEWLWQGPPQAEVTAVTVEAVTEAPAPGFRIER